MPSARKSPELDLSALLQKLNDAQIEFILVGGLAAVVQGAPITTFVLDILSVIEQGLGYEELLPYTVGVEFKGHQLHVLSLEAMIRLKHESTDPHERYRLKVYQETLRLQTNGIRGRTTPSY
jgi:hypothetical protein